MISAGNYGNQNAYGYGTPPPPGYGYPGGYMQPQGPQVGSYTPIQHSGNVGTAMPGINVSAEMGADMGDKVGDLLKNQTRWAGWGSAMNATTSIVSDVCNAILAHKSLEVQGSVAKAFYKTQGKIAEFQKDVAIEQLDVQRCAVNAQREMHGEQMRHEEKMLRLEGSIQARLAKITEDGKTKRAEIMSMTDAFARCGWDMGTPAIAA